MCLNPSRRTHPPCSALSNLLLPGGWVPVLTCPRSAVIAPCPLHPDHQLTVAVVAVEMYAAGVASIKLRAHLSRSGHATAVATNAKLCVTQAWGVLGRTTVMTKAFSRRGKHFISIESCRANSRNEDSQQRTGIYKAGFWLVDWFLSCLQVEELVVCKGPGGRESCFF